MGKKYELPKVELSSLPAENAAYQDDEVKGDDIKTSESKSPISESKNDVEDSEGIGMKKTVGFLGAISLIVGSIIGSGIFSSPAVVLVNSGSVGMTLIAWAGSGMIAILGALCYVELGCMIRMSGGEYAYSLKAYGELPAFLFTFTSAFLLKPAAISAICLACGSYIVEPFFPFGCYIAERQSMDKMFAAVCIGE